MPGTKRLGDEDGDDITTPVSAKAPRPDGSNGDFSSSVKKKIAGSSRTGQACDRCKVRKIRCDARLGGCSPCLQNNTECKTTDRITGRATSRGHTEQLENENTTLRVYVVELQQQLRDSGAEPKAPPRAQSYAPQAIPYWDQQIQHAHAQWDVPQHNSTSLLAEPRTQYERKGSQGALLPDFRAGCIGENYLGVSSGNTWLSPIEGTSLALFGTKIDLAEYMPSESEPLNSALSYQTFLDHAFGRTKPLTPPLPPYDLCKVYGEWYFRSIQQLVPLLHKPDWMQLIDRIHHRNHEPNAAETVMVHMVLATINFQFSIRNGNEQARNDSVNHYHYSLSFIPDLITGHKLQDIQALAVICSYLRSQPRPGAAWMFTNMVMGLAIESGLHRSDKAWQGSADDQDQVEHQREMRQRIFWGLLCYHVHLSGKLGRPMPLRLEDFDIEIPTPTDDNLPSEANLSQWRRCSWRSAIEGFKLGRIMMQVYSTIYSIKSVGQYETNVQQLEKELDVFVSEVPPELRGGSQTRDEDRVSAVYLDLSVAECQLLLHHPALCRSVSPQVMSHNLDVCLHWSGKALSAAVQLKDLKSLDSTWYYSTDFLAAIFTTLFTHTERKDQMTSADLQRLRHDMDQWLDVMGEVGHLLGTGPKLQNAIHNIIEFALGNISRHLAAKTASAAVASAGSPAAQEQSHPHQLYNNSSGYSSIYANGDGQGNGASSQTQTYGTAQLAYAQPPPHNLTSYSSGNMAGFDGSAYSSEDVKPTIEQLGVHNPSMTPQSHQPNFLTPFQSPHTQDNNGYHQQSPHTANLNGQSGPVAWRNFATSMMTNMSGQEYMTSAGALMALSGGKPADASMDMTAANFAAMDNMQMPPTDINSQPWPLIHYHNGAGNGQ